MSTEELDKLEEGVGRILRKGAKRGAAGARRAWNKGKTLNPSQWDEALHPRDRKGRFIDVPGKIFKLRPGAWYDLKEMVSAVNNASLQSPTPQRSLAPDQEYDLSDVQVRTKVDSVIAGLPGDKISGATIYRIKNDEMDGYEVRIGRISPDGGTHYTSHKIPLREVLETDNPARELENALKDVLEGSNNDPGPEFEALGFPKCACGCGANVSGSGQIYISGHNYRNPKFMMKGGKDSPGLEGIVAKPKKLSDYGYLPNTRYDFRKDPRILRLNQAKDDQTKHINRRRQRELRNAAGAKERAEINKKYDDELARTTGLIDKEIEQIKKDGPDVLQRINQLRRHTRSKLIKQGANPEREAGTRELLRDVGDYWREEFWGLKRKKAKIASEVQAEFDEWAEEMIKEGKNPNDHMDEWEKHRNQNKSLKTKLKTKLRILPKDPKPHWSLEDPFRDIPAHVQRRAARTAIATGRRQFVYVDIANIKDNPGILVTDPDTGKQVVDWDNPDLYVISDKLEWFPLKDSKGGMHEDGFKYLNENGTFVLRGWYTSEGQEKFFPTLRPLIDTYIPNIKKGDTLSRKIDGKSDKELLEMLEPFRWNPHDVKTKMRKDDKKYPYYSDEEQRIDEFIGDFIYGKRKDDLPENFVDKLSQTKKNEVEGFDGDYSDLTAKEKKQSYLINYVNNKFRTGEIWDDEGAMNWYNNLMAYREEHFTDNISKKRPPSAPSRYLRDMNRGWEAYSALDLGLTREITPGPSGVTYATKVYRSVGGKYIIRGRSSGGSFDVFQKSGSKYKYLGETYRDLSSAVKAASKIELDKEIDDIFDQTKKVALSDSGEDAIVLQKRADMFDRQKDNLKRKLDRLLNVEQTKQNKPLNPTAQRVETPNAVMQKLFRESKELMPLSGEIDTDPDPLPESTGNDAFDKWFKRSDVDEVDLDDFDDEDGGSVVPDEPEPPKSGPGDAAEAPTEEVVPDDEITAELPDLPIVYRGQATYQFDQSQPGFLALYKDGERIFVQDYELSESPKVNEKNFSRAVARIRKIAKIDNGDIEGVIPDQFSTAKGRKQARKDVQRGVLSKTERQDRRKELDDAIAEMDEDLKGALSEETMQALLADVDDLLIDEDNSTLDGNGDSMLPDPGAVEKREPSVYDKNKREVDVDNVIYEDDESTYYAKQGTEEQTLIRTDGDSEEEIGKFPMDGASSGAMVDAAEEHSAKTEGVGRWLPDGDADEKFVNLDGVEYRIVEQGGDMVMIKFDVEGNETILRADKIERPNNVTDLVTRKKFLRDGMRMDASLDSVETRVDPDKLEVPDDPDRWHASPLGRGDLVVSDRAEGFYYLMRTGSHREGENNVHEYNLFHFKRKNDTWRTEVRDLDLNFTDVEGARPEFLGRAWDKVRRSDKKKNKKKETDRSPKDGFDPESEDTPDNLTMSNLINDRRDRAMEAIGDDDDEYAEIMLDEDDGVWTVHTRADQDRPRIVAPDGRETNLDLKDLEEYELTPHWNSRDGFVKDNELADALRKVHEDRKTKEYKRVSKAEAPAPRKDVTPEDEGWEKIVGDTYKKDGLLLKKERNGWMVRRKNENDPIAGGPTVEKALANLKDKDTSSPDTPDADSDSDGPVIENRLKRLEGLTNANAWHWLREAAAEVDDVKNPEASALHVWYDRRVHPDTDKPRGWRITREEPEDNIGAIRAGAVLPYDKQQGQRFVVYPGGFDYTPLPDAAPELDKGQIQVVSETSKELDAFLKSNIMQPDMDLTPEQLEVSKRAWAKWDAKVESYRASSAVRRRNLNEAVKARKASGYGDMEGLDVDRLDPRTTLDAEFDSKLSSWLDEGELGSPLQHDFGDGVRMFVYKGGHDKFTAVVRDKDGQHRWHFREAPGVARLQGIADLYKGRNFKPQLFPFETKDGQDVHGIKKLVTSDSELAFRTEDISAQLMVDIFTEKELVEQLDRPYGLRTGSDPHTYRFEPGGAMSKDVARRLRDELLDGSGYVWDKDKGIAVLDPSNPNSVALRQEADLIRGRLMADLGVDPDEFPFTGDVVFGDTSLGEMFREVDISDQDWILLDPRFTSTPTDDSSMQGMISFDIKGNSFVQLNPRVYTRNRTPVIKSLYDDVEKDLTPEQKHMAMVQVLTHELMHSISVKSSDEGRADDIITDLTRRDDFNSVLGLEEGMVEASTAVHIGKIGRMLGYSDAIDMDDNDIFRAMMGDHGDDSKLQLRHKGFIRISGYHMYMRTLEMIRNSLEMDRNDFYATLRDINPTERASGLTELVDIRFPDRDSDSRKRLKKQIAALMPMMHPGIMADPHQWNVSVDRSLGRDFGEDNLHVDGRNDERVRGLADWKKNILPLKDGKLSNIEDFAFIANLWHEEFVLGHQQGAGMPAHPGNRPTNMLTGQRDLIASLDFNAPDSPFREGTEIKLWERRDALGIENPEAN